MTSPQHSWPSAPTHNDEGSRSDPFVPAFIMDSIQRTTALVQELQQLKERGGGDAAERRALRRRVKQLRQEQEMLLQHSGLGGGGAASHHTDSSAPAPIPPQVEPLRTQTSAALFNSRDPNVAGAGAPNRQCYDDTAPTSALATPYYSRPLARESAASPPSLPPPRSQPMPAPPQTQEMAPTQAPAADRWPSVCFAVTLAEAHERREIRHRWERRLLKLYAVFREALARLQTPAIPSVAVVSQPAGDTQPPQSVLPTPSPFQPVPAAPVPTVAALPTAPEVPVDRGALKAAQERQRRYCQEDEDAARATILSREEEGFISLKRQFEDSAADAQRRENQRLAAAEAAAAAKAKAKADAEKRFTESVSKLVSCEDAERRTLVEQQETAREDVIDGCRRGAQRIQQQEKEAQEAEEKRRREEEQERQRRERELQEEEEKERQRQREQREREHRNARAALEATETDARGDVASDEANQFSALERAAERSLQDATHTEEERRDAATRKDEGVAPDGNSSVDEDVEEKQPSSSASSSTSSSSSSSLSSSPQKGVAETKSEDSIPVAGADTPSACVLPPLEEVLSAAATILDEWIAAAADAAVQLQTVQNELGQEENKEREDVVNEEASTRSHLETLQLTENERLAEAVEETSGRHSSYSDSVKAASETEEVDKLSGEETTEAVAEKVLDKLSTDVVDECVREAAETASSRATSATASSESLSEEGKETPKETVWNEAAQEKQRQSVLASCENIFAELLSSAATEAETRLKPSEDVSERSPPFDGGNSGEIEHGNSDKSSASNDGDDNEKEDVKEDSDDVATAAAAAAAAAALKQQQEEEEKEEKEKRQRQLCEQYATEVASLCEQETCDRHAIDAQQEEMRESIAESRVNAEAAARDAAFKNALCEKLEGLAIDVVSDAICAAAEQAAQRPTPEKVAVEDVDASSQNSADEATEAVEEHVSVEESGDEEKAASQHSATLPSSSSSHSDKVDGGVDEPESLDSPARSSSTDGDAEAAHEVTDVEADTVRGMQVEKDTEGDDTARVHLIKEVTSAAELVASDVIGDCLLFVCGPLSALCGESEPTARGVVVSAEEKGRSSLLAALSADSLVLQEAAARKTVEEKTSISLNALYAEFSRQRDEIATAEAASESAAPIVPEEQADDVENLKTPVARSRSGNNSSSSDEDGSEEKEEMEEEDGASEADGGSSISADSTSAAAGAVLLRYEPQNVLTVCDALFQEFVSAAASSLCATTTPEVSPSRDRSEEPPETVLSPMADLVPSSSSSGRAKSPPPPAGAERTAATAAAADAAAPTEENASASSSSTTATASVSGADPSGEKPTASEVTGDGSGALEQASAQEPAVAARKCAAPEPPLARHKYVATRVAAATALEAIRTHADEWLAAAAPVSEWTPALLHRVLRDHVLQEIHVVNQRAAGAGGADDATPDAAGAAPASDGPKPRLSSGSVSSSASNVPPLIVSFPPSPVARSTTASKSPSAPPGPDDGDDGQTPSAVAAPPSALPPPPPTASESSAANFPGDWYVAVDAMAERLARDCMTALTRSFLQRRERRAFGDSVYETLDATQEHVLARLPHDHLFSQALRPAPLTFMMRYFFELASGEADGPTVWGGGGSPGVGGDLYFQQDVFRMNLFTGVVTASAPAFSVDDRRQERRRGASRGGTVDADGQKLETIVDLTPEARRSGLTQLVLEHALDNIMEHLLEDTAAWVVSAKFAAKEA